MWFLQAFEAVSHAVQQIVDMPMAKLELLQKFIEQTQGILSQPAREKKFLALTDAEVARVETLFAEAFNGPGAPTFAT